MFTRLLPILLISFFFLMPAHLRAAVPQVQEIHTPKGLTVWLIEDHHLPVVSVRAAFDASGDAYAATSPQGAPYFAARMLSEGAGDLAREAFAKALQERAISLNVGFDHDHLSFELDALSEHFAKGIELAGLALSAPRFDKSDIERVRGELLSQLRLQEQKPDYHAARAFRAAAYASHPYSRALLGTEQTLKSMTRNDLKNSLHLRADTLRIAVSGDVTAAQVSKAVDDAFASLLPVGIAPPQRIRESVWPLNQQAIVKKAAFPQAVVTFALPGLARSDPDFYAAYLMNYMLGGGGFDSRLTDEVRRKRGLTYSVYTGFVMDDASKLLQGGLATQASKAKEALQVVREVIKDVHDHGFTEDEL
ncbi:MAG: insulinase family protein, partial [Rickettsiales bacterium]|nr:insulinase family protein [Rickettsiales bacterium]